MTRPECSIARRHDRPHRYEEAGEGALLLAVEADADHVGLLEDVMGRHLVRFGTKEGAGRRVGTCVGAASPRQAWRGP